MTTLEMTSFNPREYAAKRWNSTQAAVTFNIIHVDDINKSKMAKLEAWKSLKDPNEVGVDRLNKSNKLIREVDVDEDQSNPSAPTTDPASVYKLTLKDKLDNHCFAYEYEDKLPFLRTGSTLPIPIKLGGELVVKAGTPVVNGALLLKRDFCIYKGVDDNLELVKALNSNLVEKSINILQNPVL